MKSLLIKCALPFIHFYRQRLRGMSHQRLDMDRMRRKWALLEKELDARTGELLDIGCNEGFFTRLATQKGWRSVGIDVNEATIRYARKKHADLPNIRFMNASITRPFVEQLPEFDVILLLSVFQEIYVALGREEALHCFGALLAKCRQKMLFETASTNAKYAGDRLFAKDNDQASVEAWIATLVATHPGWQARLVGATAYSNTEPYRYLFAIERTTE
ncbi:MAG: class I SAM-dependent methyltransferase [Alphaproteobacteria bacterium]|nr:class I SAM-dependent methyltransferase [Alphaproteobacteria bacterium]